MVSCHGVAVERRQRSQTPGNILYHGLGYHCLVGVGNGDPSKAVGIGGVAD